LDNSGMSRTEATAEVERYIAIPSQALAYKVGALTILRLRQEAEEALGARFDLKAFHAQVLNTGALPLPVLERKVRDWIATQRGRVSPVRGNRDDRALRDQGADRGAGEEHCRGDQEAEAGRVGGRHFVDPAEEERRGNAGDAGDAVVGALELALLAFGDAPR